MKNELYAFFISLFAGLSTLIGSLFIFIKIDKDKITNYLAFFLAFSVAVMISVSLFDLLPAGLPILINTWKYKAILVIFICFIIAYILIKYLNKIISNNQGNLYKVGILSMIILIIHNLPEGIITYLGSLTNLRLGFKLAIAISLHNIPEGILISMPIYMATKKKSRAVGYAFLSGISEPIGALITFIFLKKYISNLIIGLILIIVSGLMIVLAIENIFPEIKNFDHKRYIYLGFLIGVVIICLSLFI